MDGLFAAGLSSGLDISRVSDGAYLVESKLFDVPPDNAVFILAPAVAVGGDVKTKGGPLNIASLQVDLQVFAVAGRWDGGVVLQAVVGLFQFQGGIALQSG